MGSGFPPCPRPPPSSSPPSPCGLSSTSRSQTSTSRLSPISNAPSQSAASFSMASAQPRYKLPLVAQADPADQAELNSRIPYQTPSTTWNPPVSAPQGTVGRGQEAFDRG